MVSTKKLGDTVEILKEYNGRNPYILMLKRDVVSRGELDKIDDFQVDYIIKNKDFEPKPINKTIKLADWYAARKKEDWKTEFIPEKVKVISLLGETDTTYHCYVKYRQSVDPVMCFLPKKAVLNNFLVEDYRSLNIDFNRYDRISSEKDKNRVLLPHQKDGVKFLLSRKKCILADSQGLGKMEPVSALIPTPNGFERMGNITVGDQVFGEDGKPHKVIQVFPHKNKRIYRVTFNDNTSVECGLDHLWKVRRKQDKEWKVMSLRYIINKGYQYGICEIPLCKPIEYSEKKYKISPYDYGKAIDKNKHSVSIATKYKFGSIKQRRELLNGLMSYDDIENRGRSFCYDTQSFSLAKDIEELVYSLGGTVHITHIGNIYLVFIEPSKNHNPKYIISAEYVRNEDAQCIMVDSEDHTYLTGRHYIVTHNTTTLAVSAIEGNFDSVVIICPASLKTNWSKELQWYVPSENITILESFQTKTKGELETFLGYPEGKSGKKRDELMAEAAEKGKWESNRFVILNYDILDEFVKLPSTRSKVNINESFKNSPLLRYIYNRKSLLIIDEAHKLSNSTSNRYKLIKSLIKRGNPESIYLSTGTPVTNNPQNLYCLLQLLDDPITSDWVYYMKRYCDAKEFVSPKDKEKRNMITSKYVAERGKSSWYALTEEEKETLQKIVRSKCKMITAAQGASNLDELKERISHMYLRREKEDMGNLPQKTVHEVHYQLNIRQKAEYDRLWEEYETAKKEENPETELNKDLLEGFIYRRYLSNEIVPYTEKLADKFIKNGEKVIIACCFDEELYTLKEYYGDKCVIYNGKMNSKQKDKAVKAFMNDPNVMVFLANIVAAGVGLTLISAHRLIFNDMSFVPADNFQMEDRIHRIGQTEDCHVYYQIFDDTQYENMWNIVMRKAFTINQIIKKESEK